MKIQQVKMEVVLDTGERFLYTLQPHIGPFTSDMEFRIGATAYEDPDPIEMLYPNMTFMPASRATSFGLEIGNIAHYELRRLLGQHMELVDDEEEKSA